MSTATPMIMIFSILKTLALGIWIGSLLMLGIAVAGPIFQQSPSKTLAGAINGVILHRMNGIEWVAGSVALLMALILLVLHWQDSSRGLRIAECALVAVSLVLLWWYSNSITGRMNELRASIGDFDHPQATPAYVQQKAEFDDLHHSYTRLVSINMVLLVGEFVLSMITATRP